MLCSLFLRYTKCYHIVLMIDEYMVIYIKEGEKTNQAQHGSVLLPKIRKEKRHECDETKI